MQNWMALRGTKSLDLHKCLSLSYFLKIYVLSCMGKLKTFIK